MIESFGPVLLFLVVAVVFAVAPLVVSALVRPQRPDAVKLSPYECGMELLGSPRVQFRARFYLYALLFAIFDVEAIFIFPWAVTYSGLGWVALVEMALFIAILLVGFAYAWRKGVLEWR
ncbi:MAG TPA: NADH-quinone oxidoreductase subunit A [Chloroflexota bacterium]|nr:NADH-quinone oxidoreductase subunit A [Chloroflexota bacterium]